MKLLIQAASPIRASCPPGTNWQLTRYDAVDETDDREDENN